MIHYLVTSRFRHPMETYLSTWGRDLAGQVQVVSYESLAWRRRFAAGTYIFSDLERLRGGKSRLLLELWNQLAGLGEQVRLLNHPARALRRPALLAQLHRRGINSYQAYPATDFPETMQYPVFVRPANEHRGSVSGLLTSAGEVREAIRAAARDGWRPTELLVVEKVATEDESGVVRKYSAFCIGGRIIPRHLIFGRDWVLKMPDLIDEARVAEERAFLEANPHQDILKEVFRIASIDYGRIDYGVVDGRVQVWEINTNPIVMLRPETYHPLHLPAQQWFAPQAMEAFRQIDTPHEGREGRRAIPLPLTARLRASVPDEWLTHRLRRLRARVGRL